MFMFFKAIVTIIDPISSKTGITAENGGPAIYYSATVVVIRKTVNLHLYFVFVRNSKVPMKKITSYKYNIYV